MKVKQNYPKLRPSEIVELVSNWIKVKNNWDTNEDGVWINKEVASATGRMLPYCIEGSHGIGKTEIVEDIAKSMNMDFVKFACGEIEEAGDISGMPSRDEENGRTIYLPPPSVAQMLKSQNPNGGILYFDDVNRAPNKSVLNAIMNILQFGQCSAWKLPQNWVIVCSRNPEGIGYSVISMDGAHDNRLGIVEMVFDIEDWARWAMSPKSRLTDERLIAFPLAFAELFNAQSHPRNTARSLTAVIEELQAIDFDKPEKRDLALSIVGSKMDEAARVNFSHFIDKQYSELPTPSQILACSNKKGEDIHALVDKISKLVGYSRSSSNGVRADLIYIITKRLEVFISENERKLTDLECYNVAEYLKFDGVPADQRFQFMVTISKSTCPNPHAKKIIAKDAALGELLLSKM